MSMTSNQNTAAGIPTGRASIASTTTMGIQKTLSLQQRQHVEAWQTASTLHYRSVRLPQPLTGDIQCEQTVVFGAPQPGTETYIDVVTWHGPSPDVYLPARIQALNKLAVKTVKWIHEMPWERDYIVKSSNPRRMSTGVQGQAESQVYIFSQSAEVSMQATPTRFQDSAKMKTFVTLTTCCRASDASNAELQRHIESFQNRAFDALRDIPAHYHRVWNGPNVVQAM